MELLVTETFLKKKEQSLTIGFRPSRHANNFLTQSHEGLHSYETFFNLEVGWLEHASKNAYS